MGGSLLLLCKRVGDHRGPSEVYNPLIAEDFIEFMYYKKLLKKKAGMKTISIIDKLVLAIWRLSHLLQVLKPSSSLL